MDYDHATHQQRYELKLTCAAHLLAHARMWVRLHPAGLRPTYPTRQVNNLYLDTPHLNSFSANQTGMSTRQKLRLRWYGAAGNDLTQNPTLELKLKSGLLGDKKQTQLNCTIDWQRPWGDILSTIQRSAGERWRRWLRAANQPTLINWYKREYYETFDGEVRVTLDYAQAACDQRMGGRPNFSRHVPLEDLVVIEVKGAPEVGERLQAVVAAFPIGRTRNSKYVNGVAASFN